ncbi:segregation and condensation protein A [Sphingopyxis indica]|uniref:Segregation and condensation protein A n=1 Tax=Sphingopyxis indica TaxID=436663 RepID=A0A239DMH3_9SPHN|nr:ScpA family protein [Sphingopyxis indica]WOF44810.1 segregation/condensation protein A [Sphingopyxis indica]SNS33835.1 condensin subunit ScpA [Sphingopyxis indica]
MDEDLPLDFEIAPAAAERDEALQISLESWEGPLDLLLTLARGQKVDLRQISILALVEQYLAFIAEMRALKLEVAADYLVMAAWLAYLKSALLLPKDPEAEPSPDELALRLQLRLQRLAAMREAAARLLARDRLGRDVFARPKPEGLHEVRVRRWDASLYDLLSAYGRVKLRTEPVIHMVSRRPVVTLDAALHHLERLIGVKLDWTELSAFLPSDYDGPLRRSAIASSFLAALELARQGRVELKQDGAFEPLYLKAPSA